MPSSSWEKFTKSLPSVLFNLTLRFTLLRTICLAAIVLNIHNFVWASWGNIMMPGLVAFIIILVHHFASAFGPRLSLPGGIDLALIFAEIALSIMGLNNVINRQSTRIYAFAGAMAYITTISLSLLAMMRIVQALKKGWPFLWTQYDITGPECRHTWSKSPNTSDPEGGLEDKPESATQMLSTSDVLFGRSIWKAHFLGEAKWMILFRGILAAAIIVIIALYTVYLVIIEPVRETSLTPIRDSRSLGFPSDFPKPELIWNVVVGKPVPKNASYVDISPAVKVVYLNDDANSTTQCTQGQTNVINSRLDSTYDQVALALTTFQCSPAAEEHEAYPDILVTVNFTLLNVTTNTAAKTRWNSVQVMLGRTQDTRDVARRTPGTMLIPGMNLVGVADRQFRQLDTNPSLAALGILESFKTFVSSELIQLWPDPRTSPDILRGSDVSTLRIVTPFDFSEWKIIEQNRERSVLKGLAGVGGLWTFIGGIFTLLFGSTIIRIIFGSKPISLFGITRVFEGDKIADAYRTEYPCLESELKVDPARKGLVAFLSDHLIDFEFLERRPGLEQGPINEKASNIDSSTSKAYVQESKVPKNFNDTTPLLPMTAVSDTFSLPESAPSRSPEIGYSMLSITPLPNMDGPSSPPPMTPLSQSHPEDNGAQSN